MQLVQQQTLAAQMCVPQEIIKNVERIATYGELGMARKSAPKSAGLIAAGGAGCLGCCTLAAVTTTA